MRAVHLVVAAHAGAIAGSAATRLWLSASLEETSPSPAALTAPGTARAAPDETMEADRRPLLTMERLAVYAATAETTEPNELEARIRRTAALPRSARRAFELDALLMRLAELEAKLAVSLARTLDVDTEQMVRLFRFWAEREPNAALAELGRVEDPAATREIALALVDVLGGDARSIERVAVLLSPAQVPAFELEAAVRLAGTDPRRALQYAATLADSNSRTSAVSRIAAEWARRDPAAAIEQADSIADAALRESYRTAALSEWARIAPDAVFAYLRARDLAKEPSDTAGPVLSALAMADPTRVMELAGEMPRTMRAPARQLALRTMVQRDPLAAIALLDAMPRTPERESLAGAVGLAYGQHDPEGALEWARSLQPPSTSLLRSVLNGIASVDPERALGLALDGEPGTMPSVTLPFLVTLSQVPDTSRLPAMANRLVEHDDPRVLNQIGSFLSRWARREPDAAVDWIAANAERVGGSAISRVATELGTEDPIAAAAVMHRLPPELRDDWLEAVAAAYAQRDAVGAAAWIDQYRGQQGFAAALAAMAPAMARTDPGAAARLLERVDARVAAPVVPQVATAWTARDPAAAADWAVQLADFAARRNAIHSVINAWTERDFAGARQWVLGQPSGDARDEALVRLLSITAAAGSSDLDGQLLNAFSADSQRHAAVVDAALQRARYDRDDARRLIDQYVMDTRARQQAYAAIERL